MNESLELLYNKLIFFGYTPEEVKFDSNLTSFELITRVDEHVDLNKIVNLLNNDDIWNNIVSHILKIDNTLLNIEDLNLLKDCLLNNNLIIYSTALGSNFVSSGLFLNKLSALNTDLNVCKLNNLLISSGFMFLVCSYSFLVKYNKLIDN